MKFYYKDPLAAAFMANHFGMRFSEGATAFSVNVMSGGINTPKSYKIGSGVDDKIYIHSDSLHILEPQLDDLVLDEDNFNAIRIELSLQLTQCKGSEIIRRGDIPFMMPEVEP